MKTIGMILCAAMLAAPAWADDAERVRDLERRLERSMQLIEQLTQRVNELERERGRTPAAAPPRPEPPPARTEPVAIAPLPEARLDRGVPLHGFADAGYEHSTQQRSDGRKGGFVLGNLDFFLTPNFERVKMLAELVFEVDDQGGLATDLERLQFGYVVSDAMTVWLGRFHTPYGYWNAAFHHGAQIQTSVTRPRFVDFEDKGGFLPAHSVGLWATGRIPAGPGKVQYDAYLSNGNRIADGVLDFNAHRDDNGNKTFGANVGYRFGGDLDGLLVGVHGLRGDVDAYAGDVLLGRTQVGMAGGYYALEMGPWESYAEYYRFRNKDRDGGGTHTSWAGFAQVGYTFMEDWTPFYRYEKAALSDADIYFAAQDSGRPYRRHVFGLRYALNPNTALKVEANRTTEYLGEERSYSEARAQFAVRF